MSLSNETKRLLLERLLSQAEGIKVRSSSDPYFKTWRNTVERTLIRIYGPESPEVKQFQDLDFFYHAIIMTLGSDYSAEHRRCFERDLDILLASIRNYIEEIETRDEPPTEEVGEKGVRRVFISHSSKDEAIVQELVEVLETVGLASETIFCTSLAGYGIDLGENFLDGIREELKSDTLVLFVLSHNFYMSAISLCEMGAVWVQTKAHIPILVPPFDFGDIKGVIPLTEGFKINDPLKLSLFKTRIETLFGLSPAMPPANWERKRDRILARINDLIEKNEPSRRGTRR